MSLTPAQRHQAIGLYRRVMRTARQTFNNDAATITAWRSKVRSQWEAASRETDAAKIDEAFNTWEDVVKILRQNIVQGVYNPEREAYQLQFTPETELGSNESVKEGREKQLEQLRKSKGSLRCGSATSAQAGPSTLGGSTARTFSTSAMQAEKFKNEAQSSSDLANAAMAFTAAPLPRPPAQFDQVTLLSDGSSIRLMTTSPRSFNQLTRDPTNHPLWNPSMERGQGASEEDESGRVARFRKRFGGRDGATGATDEASLDSAGGVPPAGQRGNLSFGSEDLDWMSVGGREAKGSTRLPPAKAKGKGKK